MRPEIDIDEEIRLVLGKNRPHRKEATVKRMWAGPVNGCFKGGPIGRLKRTDHDIASVSQRLDRGIVFGVCHQLRNQSGEASSTPPVYDRTPAFGSLAPIHRTTSPMLTDMSPADLWRTRRVASKTQIHSDILRDNRPHSPRQRLIQNAGGSEETALEGVGQEATKNRRAWEQIAFVTACSARRRGI
jgi:hypothetical protein